MTDRIAIAAHNNAQWCDLVARSHGVVCTTDAAAWTAATRTPPFYPDAVTLSPSIRRLGGADGCEWHGFIRGGRFETCGDAR